MNYIKHSVFVVTILACCIMRSAHEHQAERTIATFPPVLLVLISSYVYPEYILLNKISNVNQFVVSPDGQFIAYESSQPREGIKPHTVSIYNASTKESKVLIEGEEFLLGPIFVLQNSLQFSKNSALLEVRKTMRQGALSNNSVYSFLALSGDVLDGHIADKDRAQNSSIRILTNNNMNKKRIVGVGKKARKKLQDYFARCYRPEHSALEAPVVAAMCSINGDLIATGHSDRILSIAKKQGPSAKEFLAIVKSMENGLKALK